MTAEVILAYIGMLTPVYGYTNIHRDTHRDGIKEEMTLGLCFIAIIWYTRLLEGKYWTGRDSGDLAQIKGEASPFLIPQ